MRLTRAFFCIPLVLLSSGASRSEAEVQSEGVIVGWNIAGVEPIPSARLARIVQVIRRINPDVLILSEVNPNEAAFQIAQQLGPGYRAVLRRQNETVVQNIAVIHNSRATVGNARLIDESDLPEEERSRRALAVDVWIGQFDFLLIGVHLKSGRSATNRAQRTRQVAAISTFIDQTLNASERDVLVVGDYNMIPPTPTRANDRANFNALNAGGRLRFISSESLAGRPSHFQRCSPPEGNLLDGFAIARNDTREFVEGSIRLLSFSELGHTCEDFVGASGVVGVSDHAPVLARFSVVNDDD
jgi:exonuclease III